MAKASKIAAQRRRERTVARYAERRADLKEQIRRAEPGSDELADAVRALARLPRDSSPVRLRHRDQVDGRPRGYVRKVGLSRIRFREMAHRGELPGIVKSSW
ncbi:30S ribosomal protein S14 [Nocardioides sp.]|uniref:30S ribosomal protein S14 n=1 Tax=Nocardioides sp. TaxID=35761 RepID=UPI003519391A